MPEAVIVDAVRTPIGRAFKGSLAQLRPDEMGAFVVDPLLERNPQVDPALIEDLYMRLRHAAGPPGLQHRAASSRCCPSSCRSGVTGATISRYCASSLESIRAAANAVTAGQGDTYIAAGVEWVSRYNERTEAAGEADQNEHLQGKNGDPDAYIAMGLTAENVAEQVRGEPGGHGQVRPALPGAGGQVTGGRLLRPRDRAGHPAGRHGGGQGRRAASELDAREALAARARLPPRRKGHRRQLVSAQRRRGRGARDVRLEGRTSSASRRAPGSSRPPPPGSSPRSWASARSARSRRCSTAPA